MTSSSGTQHNANSSTATTRPSMFSMLMGERREKRQSPFERRALHYRHRWINLAKPRRHESGGGYSGQVPASQFAGRSTRSATSRLDRAPLDRRKGTGVGEAPEISNSCWRASRIDPTLPVSQHAPQLPQGASSLPDLMAPVLCGARFMWRPFYVALVLRGACLT